MPQLSTPHIEIGYEEHGSPTGRPVVLLHGYPDSVRAWDRVIAALGSDESREPLRILVPHLRGCGSTHITSPEAETGQFASLAQDVLSLLDALAISTAFLVGHDWGARAAYSAAALAPERVSGLIALASEYVAFSGGTPSNEQVQAYWYQWYFNTEQGKQALARDRAGFGAYLWKTWSPTWKFAQAELEQAQAAWANPQYVDTVISYYRHRHKNAPGAALYATQQAWLDDKPKIAAPTIFVTGLADACNLPASSLGQEAWFTGGYERVELPGVGHFIPREAAHDVALLLRRALTS